MIETLHCNGTVETAATSLRSFRKNDLLQRRWMRTKLSVAKVKTLAHACSVVVGVFFQARSTVPTGSLLVRGIPISGV